MTEIKSNSRPHAHKTKTINYMQWSRRFDLLGDPTRLALLAHMHAHPASGVNDLADAASITQTAASQALRVLRDQGWVEATRDGRVMRYSLIDETAHALLHFIGASHSK